MYCKAIAVKILRQQHKDRHRDQERRNESPEISAYIYDELISLRRYHLTKEFNGSKHSLFNKWYWGNWVFACKKINLDPYLIPYTKIN